MSLGMVVPQGFGRFCAGDGCLFASAPGSVSTFRPASGYWEHVATTAPIEDWDCSCAYDRGHMYRTFEDHVQSLNVSTGQWDELPSLSTEQYGATLCVVDGRVFVVGGDEAAVEEYLPLERG